MLAQVPGQILNRCPEPGEPADARMLRIETCLRESVPQRRIILAVTPGTHQAGEPVDLFGGKGERLSHFAGSASVPISDYISSHGGALFTIAIVDILNCTLAAIAAGEVQVNVGPFAALFGKEAFKQQIHADGIDGSDSQAVADGAVGCRPRPRYPASGLS